MEQHGVATLEHPGQHGAISGGGRGVVDGSGQVEGLLVQGLDVRPVARERQLGGESRQQPGAERRQVVPHGHHRPLEHLDRGLVHGAGDPPCLAQGGERGARHSRRLAELVRKARTASSSVGVAVGRRPV